MPVEALEVEANESPPTRGADTGNSRFIVGCVFTLALVALAIGGATYLNAGEDVSPSKPQSDVEQHSAPRDVSPVDDGADVDVDEPEAHRGRAPAVHDVDADTEPVAVPSVVVVQACGAMQEPRVGVDYAGCVDIKATQQCTATCNVAQGFTGEAVAVTCTEGVDGVWMLTHGQEEPHCIQSKAECSGLPAADLDDSHDATECFDRVEGEQCTVKCKSGWAPRVAGKTVTLTCAAREEAHGGWVAKGEWALAQSLQCSPIVCPIPDAERSAAHDWSSCVDRNFMATCKPTCRVRQAESWEAATVTCSENGQWTALPDAYCKPRATTPPIDPSTGRPFRPETCYMPMPLLKDPVNQERVDFTTCQSLKVGETCRLGCKQGYTGSSRKLRCQDKSSALVVPNMLLDDGEARAPKCKPAQCAWDTYSVYDYKGCITGNSVLWGDQHVGYKQTCKVRCSARRHFEPQDPNAPFSILTCAVSGALEGEKPLCKKMPRCGLSEELIAGLAKLKVKQLAMQATCKNLRRGQSCSLSCKQADVSSWHQLSSHLYVTIRCNPQDMLVAETKNWLEKLDRCELKVEPTARTTGLVV